MNKILTVGIPTYNRPSCLEETLKVLKLSDQSTFEILISDDSTNNEVFNIVEKYKTQLTNIQYVRNSKNLGFNRNVAQLYKLCHTKYIWFLCDDDSIETDSIDKIIKCIKQVNPTVAIFGCTWINSYGEKATAGVKERRLHCNISEFKDYDVLLRMTFLSILVFEKKEEVIEVIATHSEFDENVFVQLSLGLDLLSRNFRLCEAIEVVLHRNVGYKYGEFIKFNILDPLKAVHLVNHGFDNQKFKILMLKNLPTIILLKLSERIGLFTYKGSMSHENKRKMHEYYGLKSYLLNLLLWSVTIIPRPIIKIIFYFKLLIKHKSIRTSATKYRSLIDRANKDSRQTAFTEYS